MFSLMVVLVAQSVAPSAANQEALNLDWHAPADCPGPDHVKQLVAELVGGKAEGKLDVVAELSRDAEGRFHARLSTLMHGVGGERSLQAETCEELARASALVMALMLKPKREQPALEPPPAAPPPQPEPAPPPDEIETPPLPSEEQPARTLFFLRGATTTGVGTLPGIATGAEVHGVLHRGLGSVELRLGLWFPKTEWSTVRPEAGGRFWLLELSPFLCLTPKLESVRLDSCAGAGLGRLAATGFGVSDPSTNSALYGSLTLEQAASIALTESLNVRLSAQLLRPLSRPSFAIENVGEIHRADPLGFRGTLAAEIRL